MQSQVPLLSFGCAHISHRIDSGRGCHLWETIEPFRFSRDDDDDGDDNDDDGGGGGVDGDNDSTRWPCRLSCLSRRRDCSGRSRTPCTQFPGHFRMYLFAKHITGITNKSLFESLKYLLSECTLRPLSTWTAVPQSWSNTVLVNLLEKTSVYRFLMIHCED